MTERTEKAEVPAWRKLVPPLAGALIKNEQDAHLLERLAFMTRRRSE